MSFSSFGKGCVQIVLPSRTEVREKALASSRDSRQALSSAVQMRASSGGMIDSSFMAHLHSAQDRL
jgi:hypothetical protein